VNDTLADAVWDRAGHRCEYCKLVWTKEQAVHQVDHVTAKAHGGATAMDNLALACWHCNCYKSVNLSGLDPSTQRIARLFDPRSDEWNRHFMWEGASIVGLTATGRATVATLRMNCEDQVLMRNALIEEGFMS
jgi:hypothetical protein